MPVDIRTTRGGRGVGRLLARAAARLKDGSGRAIDTTGEGRRTNGFACGTGTGEGVDDDVTAEGVVSLRVEAVLVLVAEEIAGVVVGGTLVVVELEDSFVTSFF